MFRFYYAAICCLQINVSAGLTNGATGTLVAFHWPAFRRQQLKDGDLASVVYVHFDGDIDRQHLSRVEGLTHTVEIRPRVFTFDGKRGTKINRLQFPLVPAWSITIHKSQVK